MWEFSQWARSDPIRMMHEAEAIINQILDQGGAGAGFLPLSGGTMTGPLTVKDNNLIVQNGGDYSVAVDGSGRLTTTPTAGGTTLTFASRTGYADTVVNNPVGTASATFVMMGLNVQMTALVAEAASVCLDGQITNSSNNGVTECVIMYGTGAPPANGAAQTGTVASQPARYKATAAGDYVPFSLTCLVEGLAAGTTYWLDAAVRAPSGGTASITDLDFSVFGLA